MSQDDIRKGLANARFNEKQSGILYAEIFLIAVAFGLHTQSWWVFGAAVIGLFIAISIPFIAIPLIVLLSTCWAAIGFGIGSMFDSTEASVVLAIIGFLSGLGVHMAAIQWIKDTSE
jgi:hypothetical protein